MTVLCIIATYLVGVFSARRDEREGRLLSPLSGLVIWGVTALFFCVFFFFGVAGSPPAWVMLFIAIGYHVTARRIIMNRTHETTDTKVIE